MNVLHIILQILTLVGALVIFLYGMKIMSEALMKIAGRNMRNVMAKITSRPARGILTGFFITGLIQSSSATTVLLVSFVNAGLISFTESIGVVFGANIGTTVTTWLISILGFGTNFSLYSIILPIVALSLPMFFLDNRKNKARAEFIIGFTLLFIGIFFFRENVPVIDENLSLFHRLQFFDNSFINSFLFVGLGLLITVVFQSSSATIGLTMILASQGWLTLEAALAMVIGENIGTTVTANVAAIVANRSAKRTALAHLLFNIIGMLWVLPLLGFITDWINVVVNEMISNPASHIAFGISIFHTSFNVLNVIFLTVFFKYFKQLCFKLLPNVNGLEEVFSLKYIGNNLLSTSELSILQARKEIAHMGNQVTLLFAMIPDLLLEKKEKKFARMFKKIQRSEDIIDEMEGEIANYISKIAGDDLSDHGEKRTKAMLKIIDYLESVADLSFQMTLAISKKNDANAWFTQELRNNLFVEFSLTEKSLNQMVGNLEKDYMDVDIQSVMEMNEKTRRTRDELNKAYLAEINREKLPYKTGIYYDDLLSYSTKISDYAYGVNCLMHSTSKNNLAKQSDIKK